MTRLDANGLTLLRRAHGLPVLRINQAGRTAAWRRAAAWRKRGAREEFDVFDIGLADLIELASRRRIMNHEDFAKQLVQIQNIARAQLLQTSERLGTSHRDSRKWHKILDRLGRAKSDAHEVAFREIGALADDCYYPR
jgi:hypothetical protein